MDINMIVEYIKPELLVLIAVLYAIGYVIKNSQKVRDENIPALLALMGVALAAVWVFATAPIASPQDVAMAIFTAIVQGVLVAAGAVFANQIVKQAAKAKQQ